MSNFLVRMISWFFQGLMAGECFDYAADLVADSFDPSLDKPAVSEPLPKVTKRKVKKGKATHPYGWHEKRLAVRKDNGMHWDDGWWREGQLRKDKILYEMHLEDIEVAMEDFLDSKCYQEYDPWDSSWVIFDEHDHPEPDWPDYLDLDLLDEIEAAKRVAEYYVHRRERKILGVWETPTPDEIWGLPNAVREEIIDWWREGQRAIKFAKPHMRPHAINPKFFLAEKPDPIGSHQDAWLDLVLETEIGL